MQAVELEDSRQASVRHRDIGAKSTCQIEDAVQVTLESGDDVLFPDYESRSGNSLVPGRLDRSCPHIGKYAAD